MSGQKLPYLKSFYAHSVWDKYEFNLELKDGVNFISGLNGSNKSTLLNLIYASFLDGDMVGQLSISAFASRFNFSDTTSSVFARFLIENEAQSRLIKEASEQQGRIHLPSDDIFKDEPFSIKFFKQVRQRDVVQNNLNIIDSEVKPKTYSIRVLADKCKFPAVRICSPDLNTTSKSETSQHKAAPVNARDSITEIDKRLIEIVTRFLSYEYGLFEQAVEDNMSNMEALFAGRKMLETLINSFFNETGKKVVRNAAKEIAFELMDSGEPLDIMALSHGEKSLLHMLLMVFLDHQTVRIFLLDEPETALHLSWQKKLPDAFVALAPDCQFIITTHSPGIVSGKWLQHMQDMSTIRRLQVSET